MSSKHRREELRQQRLADAIREEEEEARLASRTMWEKINDLNVGSDLKEVLWELADASPCQCAGT